MKKFLKYEGNTYEGIFMSLPGKQNYGHLMVEGVLLYGKTEDGKQGEPVEFSCGRADEVVFNVENFLGFFNLNVDHRVQENVVTKTKSVKPIKLNKREEIQVMSKDAEEIVIALKKYAVNGLVYLKDVKDVNPNKLYGHLTNLVTAKIIQRMGKDKKRGTKIKILR